MVTFLGDFFLVTLFFGHFFFGHFFLVTFVLSPFFVQVVTFVDRHFFHGLGIRLQGVLFMVVLVHDLLHHLSGQRN